MAAVTLSNHDLKPAFLSWHKSLESMYDMTTYAAKCKQNTSNLVTVHAAFRDLEQEHISISADSREHLHRLIIPIKVCIKTVFNFQECRLPECCSISIDMELIIQPSKFGR